MKKEDISQLPQLSNMNAILMEEKLDLLAWDVLGGTPLLYVTLSEDLHAKKGMKNRDIVGDFLLDRISDAIELVADTKIKNQDMEEIISMLNENLLVPCEYLVPNCLQRPEPDEVLREGHKDGVWILEPATNAIAIVIRFGLTKKPRLEELEVLLKKFKN